MREVRPTTGEAMTEDKRRLGEADAVLRLVQPVLLRVPRDVIDVRTVATPASRALTRERGTTSLGLASFAPIVARA